MLQGRASESSLSEVPDSEPEAEDFGVDKLALKTPSIDASRATPASKHHSATDDGLRFWIEPPRLSTPERNMYELFEPALPKDDPVKIMMDIQIEGVPYYYVRPRFGPYKKITPDFFIIHARTHGHLVDEYKSAKASGTLKAFDPSSSNVVRADRLEPTRKKDKLQLLSDKRRTTRRESAGASSGHISISDSESAVDDKDDDFEDFDDMPVRRSSRNPASTKFGLFSPTKNPRAPTRSSGRAKKQQTYNELGSDDDFVMNIDESEDDWEDGDPASKGAKAPKKRRKRVARPAYGFVRSTDDLDDSESELAPLHAHRDTCEKCSLLPGHILMEKVKKKGKAAYKRKKRKGPDADLERSSEDDFTVTRKHGGWVRCLKCCVASHWVCLTKLQREEILAAIVQRERDAAADAQVFVRRTELEIEETTEFVCGFCLRGGVCMQCNEPVKTEDPPTVGATADGPQEAPDVEMEDVTVDTSFPRPAIATLPAAQADENIPSAPTSTQLLFRCFTCKRPSHYDHIPPMQDQGQDEIDVVKIALAYQDGWSCQDCRRWEYPLDKILAWRSTQPNAVDPPRAANGTIQYNSPLPREYLVKWARKSYHHLEWVPHQWLLSTNKAKLSHFVNKGTKVRLLPVDHEQVVKMIQKASKTSLPPNLISATTSGKSSKAGTPDLQHARSAIIQASGDADGGDEEQELPEGEPSANPAAEFCIPRGWLTVDRILDVSFWKSRSRKKSPTKPKGKGITARGANDQLTSDEEEDELEDDDMSDDVAARPEIAFGKQPDPHLVETIEEREMGGRDVGPEDIKNVAWCFIKWRDLTHEDSSWDSPPKEGQLGYDEYVQAFTAFLSARTVDIIPLTKAERKKRDARTPRSVPIIQNPGFEQGGKLMPFQLEGLTWLYEHWHNHQQSILADEMGLGKTVQATTFMGMLVHEQVFPLLVVVPNSTITNWMREFAKWAPHVRAVQYNGSETSREIIRTYELYHKGSKDPKFHVVVTTYEAVIHKVDFGAVFAKVPRWELLLIDEGQRLKSDTSLIFRRLGELNTMHRVLMTGTPLNNNIRELFNLMHFLDPDEWFDQKALTAEFEDLDEAKLSELHNRLKPYFLRRIKAEVMTDLPPKSEVIVPVSMAPLQKEIYKTVLESNPQALAAFAGRNTGSSMKKTNLMNVLMQLRKCMQHPYLINRNLEDQGMEPEEAHKRLIETSGKLKLLELLLPKLQQKGHRVLLFSQFKIALDIIEDFVKGEHYKFLRLDGDTPSAQRQQDMDDFNKPGSDIFIYMLSTRAGGVGINLWSADTVIVFDPDFNPHQDLQAIARAHRMGQTRKVLVFKLMIKGAAEERIIQTGKRKLALDHLIVQKMDADDGEEDVQSILSHGARALFEEGAAAEIRYNEQDVENLIDKIENEEPAPATEAGQTGLRFDFAKVYEADKNELGDVAEEDQTAGDSFWVERFARAAQIKADLAMQEKTGRGVRRKATHKPMVNMNEEAEFDSPEKIKSKKDKGKRRKQSDDEDADWQGGRVSVPPSSHGGSGDEHVSLPDLDAQPKAKKARKSYILNDENGPVNYTTIPDDDLNLCGICDGSHDVQICPKKRDKRALKERRQLILSGPPSPWKDDALIVIDEQLEGIRAETKRVKEERALREARQQVKREQMIAAMKALPTTSKTPGTSSHPLPPPAPPIASRIEIPPANPHSRLPSAPGRKKPVTESVRCPVCRQTPFHLAKNCPRLQSIQGIKDVIAEHRNDASVLDVGTLKTLEDMLAKSNGTLRPTAPVVGWHNMFAGPSHTSK